MKVSVKNSILLLLSAFIIAMITKTDADAETIFECSIEKTLQVYSLHLTIDHNAQATLNIQKNGEEFGFCQYRATRGKYLTRIRVPRLYVSMTLDSCHFRQSGDLERELAEKAIIRMELASKTEYLMPFLDAVKGRFPSHCRIITYSEAKLWELLEKSTE